MSATAATSGATAGASGGKKDATTAGTTYHKGFKIFTIAKGGLMLEASVAGQKFSYRAVEGEALDNSDVAAEPPVAEAEELPMADPTLQEQSLAPQNQDIAQLTPIQ